ncbi:hypothetical protein GUITHDRAFT_112357 [Guillardia theta CCMP2712]|uniref:Anaphase-promoting complex subunit 4 WD40 domain-containing protein n=1 Tax=Guillardia theta (strain CCMP2712) TaxID=905079 RepID=L1IZH5_GUITC|nr:hypothetical protein GUITHDRAFT_112357 [Guillardia theta CCMP2712]EKX41651.1 hypothetical protein GUITHDRAFT_112357 [Guillardia theta CCMP2712]|eukprot:XP_005828631.1 hypothetical protein GUITHDRAFT_112357 [Guillardia theta CCMP2712]
MFDVAHAGENEPPFTYELPCGVAKHLRSLKLSRSPLNRCGISKCGQILATASQGGVVGLTKLGPDLTTHFPAHDDQQVRDLCWSDDGKELVSCGGTKLLLWDLRDLVDAQSSEASSPGAQTDQTVQDLLGKTKPFGGGGISSKRGGNSGDLLYCCEIIGQSLLGGSEDGSIMLWHRGESVNDLDP